MRVKLTQQSLNTLRLTENPSLLKENRLFKPQTSTVLSFIMSAFVTVLSDLAAVG